MNTRDYLLILTVFITALAVRLAYLFLLHASGVPDSTYWVSVQGIRAEVTPAVFAGVVYGVDGLSAALFGLLLKVLPNTVQTLYIVQALLDALTCVLLVRLVLRLEGDTLAAGIVGLGWALYIPAILSTGDVGVAVYLRFSLVLAAYGFVFAFSADEKAFARLYTALGLLGAFLLGFAAPTTRPLLWLWVVAPFVLMLIGRDDNVRYAIRWMIGYGVGIIAVLMGALVFFGTQADALQAVLIGLEPSGVYPDTVQAESAVFVSPAGEGIATAFKRPFVQIAPVSMVGAVGFNPDYLAYVAQTVQFTVYGVVAVFGGAWWAGQIGVRREALALVVLSASAWVAVCVWVGFVPQVGGWMVFGLVAAGFALSGTARALDDLRGYLHPLEVILLVLTVAAWLPFVDGFALPDEVRLGLVALRSVLALLLAWRLVRLWKEAAEVVRQWPGLVWMAGVIAVSVVVFFV